MRLIDADALIEGRVENDPVRIAAACAPTAYDVEAVVEKMEEIADKAVGGCHTLEPCSHMADDTKCMDCITERFTEVVRSGGKE